MVLSETSSNVIDSSLSEQLSSQLLSAFREALATKVYSAELMQLPDGSAKEGALYADLMHRQLHMIMQFIRPEKVIEDEPVPIAAAVPEPDSAPAPEFAPAPVPAFAPAPAPEFAPVAAPAPAAIPAPAPLPSPAPALTRATAPVYRGEFWDLSTLEPIPSIEVSELTQDFFGFDDLLGDRDS